MNILLVARGAGPFGGSGRNLHNMKKALASAGHSVTYCDARGAFLSMVAQIRKAAKGADIVQVIDLNPVGYAAYLATRLLRAKLVIVCQAAYAVAPLHGHAAPLARFVYRWADGVVAGSTFVAEEIRKEVPGLPVEVIDPGIDMDQFAGAATGRTRPKKPLIIGVGAVKERKGYEVAIRSVALLKDEVPEVRYVIVGSVTDSPGFFEMLRTLVHELGLERQVEFRPEIPDEELKALYRDAALFLLPSVNRGFHFEGFGMVFLEAAAYGVPSVGTKGNGIADAIEDGGSGFLVPQNDPEATAQAAKRILTDPALAERMSIRARAFAQEHALGPIARKYERLYERLLDR